jgi:molybdopterin synthase sulfur carrier subunit
MITVRYFASIREKLGCADETLELPAGIDSVQGLLEHLKQQRGQAWEVGLKNSAVLVAVNQSVAKMSAAIKDGDEIAFFPPVTGG